MVQQSVNSLCHIPIYCCDQLCIYNWRQTLMLGILRLQEVISNLVAEKCNSYCQCMTIMHNKSSIKFSGGSRMDNDGTLQSLWYLDIHLKACNFSLKWQY